MIIWRLKDPFNFRYAQAGLRGTWHPSDKSDEVCPECTSSCQKRIRPLVIEWKPNSNIIGDFIWPGLDSVAITENTLLGIQEHFRGFEPGPIEMVQDAKLKKPSKITKHYEPQVLATLRRTLSIRPLGNILGPLKHRKINYPA